MKIFRYRHNHSPDVEYSRKSIVANAFNPCIAHADCEVRTVLLTLV